MPFIRDNNLIFKDQANKYHALDEWFKTPQGIRVGLAFAAELKTVQDQLMGRRLLQLGHCGDNSWLSSLKYRQKWLVTPCKHSDQTSVLASLQLLPFERNSVDCVIAPLTLEAFAQDKSPLDEIDRILKPMGYIVFFGVNPWSFWGAALRWGRLSCFASASATLSSAFSLKHAMLQRGYSQCVLNTFYYIPPVENELLIHGLEFLNEMGKMLSPCPAGFYCFIVQKYQSCLPTPRFNAAFRDLHFAAV